MASLPYHIEKIMSLIDSECIYKERGFIKHVRLKSVSIVGDQLVLSLQPIESTGFSPRLTSIFEVSCISEYLFFNNFEISASLINWRLLTQKSAVKKLIQFAQTLPNLKEFILEIRRLEKTQTPDKHVGVHRTSGALVDLR